MMALPKKRTEAAEPWERQGGESSKAYEAFCIFRDLGAKRTTPAVAKKLGKNEALVKRWRSQHNWNARALAYDNSVQQAAFEKASKAHADMTSRHIRIAMQMQTKALEALEKIDLEMLSPKEIREYIKTATELERLSRSASLSSAESEMKKAEENGAAEHGADINEIRTKMDAMTDEQLAAYEQLCGILSPED